MSIEQKILTNIYDLCIVWNWEYDSSFVILLNEICLSRNLSVLQVTPDNREDMFNSLINQKIGFRVFLDRASEDDARFMPFVRWACEHSTYYINHYERASYSWNKAAMHYDLINSGLYTPYTIILPSYEEQSIISDIDLKQLGERFIIKPVYGSGGEGVVMDVTSMSQVNALRQKHPICSYLLQTYIVPQNLDNRPAWFRVLYCSGQVYPCWWHTESHIYAPITESETSQYDLGSLSSITMTIANLSGLDLFSTEIAFTADNLFVVVDYVNDQPDLRMQSNAVDGVPNDIVNDIARRLCELVADHVGSSSDYENIGPD